MTDKEKNEIADMVIRKMLEAKANIEAVLFNVNDVLFSLLNTYEDKEEYEKAAIIKNKIDKINNKLDQIDNQKRGEL